MIDKGLVRRGPVLALAALGGAGVLAAGTWLAAGSDAPASTRQVAATNAVTYPAGQRATPAPSAPPSCEPARPTPRPVPSEPGGTARAPAEGSEARFAGAHDVRRPEARHPEARHPEARVPGARLPGARDLRARRSEARLPGAASPPPGCATYPTDAAQAPAAPAPAPPRDEPTVVPAPPGAPKPR